MSKQKIVNYRYGYGRIENKHGHVFVSSTFFHHEMPRPEVGKQETRGCIEMWIAETLRTWGI
jgi:hypothetical protein